MSFFFHDYLQAPNNAHKEATTMVWKFSSKEPNKTPLSQAERNTKNNILGVIVKRVMIDKSESKNNKISYGYYPKLLKEYNFFLLWINKKLSNTK